MDMSSYTNSMSESKNIEARVGDTVKVYQRIKEGDKTRTQVFEGIVIARKHGKENGATITVRKISHGVGVERIFPIFLPTIEKNHPHSFLWNSRLGECDLRNPLTAKSSFSSGVNLYFGLVCQRMENSGWNWTPKTLGYLTCSMASTTLPSRDVAATRKPFPILAAL